MQNFNSIAQSVLKLSHREKGLQQRRRQRRQRRRQRHPSGLNYSPRRKVFRRGQKRVTACLSSPNCIFVHGQPTNLIIRNHCLLIQKWKAVTFNTKRNPYHLLNSAKCGGGFKRTIHGCLDLISRIFVPKRYLISYL